MLTRKPIRRKPRGPNRAGSNVAHLLEIKTRPCCVCGAQWPPVAILAHHITGAGMSQKTPDNWAIPLCWTCHTDLHNFKGFFKDWSRQYRKAWELGLSIKHRPTKEPDNE